MTDVPAALQAMVDAINAGDTDAFVAAFTDDGMVDDWGRQLTGPDGVRSWAESDAIGMNAQMEVLTAETEGETTTIRFNWKSDKFTGDSTAVAVAAGDKLRSFTILPEH